MFNSNITNHLGFIFSNYRSCLNNSLSFYYKVIEDRTSKNSIRQWFDNFFTFL